MLRRFSAIWLFAGSIACAQTAGPSLENTLTLEDKRSLQREALLIMELLQNYHYADRPFHELNARELLTRCLHDLDRDRMIFTAGDAEFLLRRFERNLKTVYLFKGDLRPAFEIHDLYAKRLAARYAWVEKRLRQRIDLDRDETIPAGAAERKSWPATEADADAAWERRLTFELVAERLRGRDEAEALAEVRRSYDNARRRLDATDALRVREHFLNAILEHFDPHSGYFSRETARRFEADLSGGVVGIGADLRLARGRVVVDRLRAGGPAERDGRLRRGDEVLSVAQTDGPETPLKGKKMREIAALVAGQPGTKVALTVQPAGGKDPVRIELARDRVDSAAHLVSGAIHTVPTESGDVRIGVLTTPAFYGQLDPKNGPAATVGLARDTRELLDAFAARGVDGVVVDLRRNGGGLMGEAVKFAGLFLNEGPVVASRALDSKTVVQSDTDPSVSHRGPLVVLTSPQSASASELFAGAMKAYRRAAVVGGETTFGKGTMQFPVDLGRQPNATERMANWGMPRVTTGRFYLPDGGTNQRVGVPSDIALPMRLPAGLKREENLPHALPPETLPLAPLTPAATAGLATLTDPLLARLRDRSAARRERLPEFDLLRRYHVIEDAAEKAPLSLQLGKREREQAGREKNLAAWREERRILATEAGFPQERLRLASVEANEALHQTALRARTLDDGRPCANRFDRDVYYHETTPGGEILELRLATFDADLLLPVCAELARAWETATGRTTAPREIRSVLADLRPRRAKDDDDEPVHAPDAFRQRLGDGLDDIRLSAGMDAFFAATLALEPDVFGGQTFSTGLRESLRIAADWALFLRDGGKAGPPAATAPAAATSDRTP